MYKHKYALKTNLSDINLYQCGSEKCKPNHCQGPAVRPYYLLHYVCIGKGIFVANGITYNLSAGQAFLICPNQISLYKADDQNPWEYMWIAFDGIMAEKYLKNAGLSKSNPIYTAKNPAEVQNALFKMVSEAEENTALETKLLGYMYLFLSALEDNCTLHKVSGTVNLKDSYIQKAIKYVDINCWRKITVNELARHVGLDRSYLCTIFKDKLNISPQDYIIKFKIDRACEMLKSNDMPIANIARLVGYNDQLGFTRIFKNKLGIPPSKFRTVNS